MGPPGSLDISERTAGASDRITVHPHSPSASGHEPEEARGKEEALSSFLCERTAAQMLDHANHFERLGIVSPDARQDSLSNGRLAAEESARHDPIDHHEHRTIAILSLGEGPAVEHPQPHGVEVRRRHGVDVGLLEQLDPLQRPRDQR